MSNIVNQICFSDRKDDILFLTEIIELLDNQNQNSIYDGIQILCKWVTGRLQKYNNYVGFLDEFSSLCSILKLGRSLTSRNVQKIILILKSFLSEILGGMKFIVFASDFIISLHLKFKSDVIVIHIESDTLVNDVSEAQKIQTGICVLIYAANEEISSELSEKMDIIMTIDDLEDHATKTYPLDLFTYDRLYLQGKISIE